MSEARRIEELSRAESLGLLAGTPLGRVVFTQHALPAIRPVNHLLDEDRIIIRTDLGTALSSAAGRGEAMVVSYEADDIDPASHLGWSVIIIGKASVLTDRREITRYEPILRPWVTGPKDEFIAIQAGIVTGFRIAASTPTAVACSGRTKPGQEALASAADPGTVMLAPAGPRSRSARRSSPVLPPKRVRPAGCRARS